MTEDVHSKVQRDREKTQRIRAEQAKKDELAFDPEEIAKAFDRQEAKYESERLRSQYVQDASLTVPPNHVPEFTQLSLPVTTGLTPQQPEEKMLRFDTGATRNVKDDELGLEGFISPAALILFAQYMHRHRKTADGGTREPDNWQKGMPDDSYTESLIRHVFDLWLLHRNFEDLSREDYEDALCGIFFNVQGLMHNRMLRRG